MRIWNVGAAGLELPLYHRDPLTKRTLSALTVRDDVGYSFSGSRGSQDHPDMARKPLEGLSSSTSVDIPRCRHEKFARECNAPKRLFASRAPYSYPDQQ